MIRLIILIAICFFCLNARGSGNDTLRNSNYGVEINQFITGSGFSTGTELLLTVTEGKRSLKVGFYYCTQLKRITGIIASHEVKLQRNPGGKIIQPYIFYNGIARLTRLKDIEDLDSEMNAGTGIYKTFEHHIGFGIRAQFNRNIYFTSCAGYGVYFGSVMKPIILEGTNELAGSNGFAPILKIGFGLLL